MVVYLGNGPVLNTLLICHPSLPLEIRTLVEEKDLDWKCKWGDCRGYRIVFIINYYVQLI